MATLEEMIRSFPHKVRPADPDQLIVNTLFNNFCDTAVNNHWKYAAGTPAGFSAKKVLEGHWMEPHSFNCGTLVDTFVRAVVNYFDNVLHRSIGGLGLSNEDSTLNFPFVSKNEYHCFDRRIVGNVRTANRSVTQVNRCLFSSHYFVKIGAKFYDPTFCTTYNNANDLIWLKLGGQKVEYHLQSKAKRAARFLLSFGQARVLKNAYYLSEDGTYAFVRTNDKSPGFSETFCMTLVTDLSPQEKNKMGIR